MFSVLMIHIGEFTQ